MHVIILVKLIGVVAMSASIDQTQPAGAADDSGPAVTDYSTADPASSDREQFIAHQPQGHKPQFAWQVPGYGVVKEIRKVMLDAGAGTLRFTDVAEFIDPPTVSFADLDDPTG